MTWFRRRHGEELQAARADLAEAREQLQHEERLTNVTRSRWPTVFHIVSESRHLRKVNHIAEDLIAIFGGNPWTR